MATAPATSPSTSASAERLVLDPAARAAESIRQWLAVSTTATTAEAIAADAAEADTAGGDSAVGDMVAAATPSPTGALILSSPSRPATCSTTTISVLLMAV